MPYRKRLAGTRVGSILRGRRSALNFKVDYLFPYYSIANVHTWCLMELPPAPAGAGRAILENVNLPKIMPHFISTYWVVICFEMYLQLSWKFQLVRNTVTCLF